MTATPRRWVAPIMIGAIASTILVSGVIQFDLSHLRTQLIALIAQRNFLKESAVQLDVEVRRQKQDLSSLRSQVEQNETQRTPSQRRLADLVEAKHRFRVALRNAQTNPQPADVIFDQGKAGKLYFSNLLSSPDYAKAVLTLKRFDVDKLYAPFLASLDLPEEMRAKLEEQLVDREMAKEDIIGLDTDLGQDVTMRDRVADSRNWKTDIRKTFGPEVLSRLDFFDGTYHLQDAVTDLATRMSFTDQPLRTDQNQQLFQLLVSSLGQKMWSLYWLIPDQVMAQSQPLLSPAQFASLKEIREEQQAAIQLRNTRLTK